jgi:hypothetical protein
LNPLLFVCCILELTDQSPRISGNWGKLQKLYLVFVIATKQLPYKYGKIIPTVDERSSQRALII